MRKFASLVAALLIVGLCGCAWFRASSEQSGQRKEMAIEMVTASTRVRIDAQRVSAKARMKPASE